MLPRTCRYHPSPLQQPSQLQTPLTELCHTWIFVQLTRGGIHRLGEALLPPPFPAYYLWRYQIQLQNELVDETMGRYMALKRLIMYDLPPRVSYCPYGYNHSCQVSL
jgi:hypothetical protein